MGKLNWLHMSDIHYNFENYDTIHMMDKTPDDNYDENKCKKIKFISYTEIKTKELTIENITVRK